MMGRSLCEARGLPSRVPRTHSPVIVTMTGSWLWQSPFLQQAGRGESITLISHHRIQYWPLQLTITPIPAPGHLHFTLVHTKASLCTCTRLLTVPPKASLNVMGWHLTCLHTSVDMRCEISR